MKTIMKLKSFLLLLIFCPLLTLHAQTAPSDMAPLSIQINAKMGDDPLVLKDNYYTNSSGEKFNITTFNFFISNIKLLKKDGTEHVVPQEDSYFLIKASDPASQQIKLRVPEGVYSKISFTIGVDSLRNTMDISRRTGPLDPAGGMSNGMYWSWNSGYIFMKMEGLSDNAPLDKKGEHKFRYHIGGFGGYNKPGLNNIRTVTLDLEKKGIINAKKQHNCKLIITADAKKIFDGRSTISIAANPSVMFSEISSLIAENYVEMFTHYSTIK